VLTPKGRYGASLALLGTPATTPCELYPLGEQTVQGTRTTLTGIQGQALALAQHALASVQLRERVVELVIVLAAGDLDAHRAFDAREVAGSRVGHDRDGERGRAARH